jgi:lipid-binding SYLF domain-containing protein
VRVAYRVAAVVVLVAGAASAMPQDEIDVFNLAQAGVYYDGGEAAMQVDPSLQPPAVGPREVLRRIAAETLAELEPDIDLEAAEGLAVFDTTKAGLLVTGTLGAGVATESDTGEETYMNLGGAGVGIGAGFADYRLVLVFEDEATYREFIDGEWSTGFSGQWVAGEAAATAEQQSLEGVDVYRVSEEGLIAQVDLIGMRFWPDEELN